MINLFTEWLNSSWACLFVGILKLMFVLVLGNHILACGWYAVGSSSLGWVNKMDLEDADLPRQYLAALHWALTQFQGNSDILPGRSFGERFYAVNTIMLTLIGLSYFVSSLTNMMMKMEALQSERTRQSRITRDYLNKHNISGGLSIRVNKYVEWKLKSQGQQQDDLEALELLPRQMLMDLFDEVRTPVLSWILFFRELDRQFPEVVRMVVIDAIFQSFPVQAEDIFKSGELCGKVYFVVAGQLNYTTLATTEIPTDSNLRRSFHGGQQPPKVTQKQLKVHKDHEPHVSKSKLTNIEVLPKTWVSEACLWTKWKHRGNLTAVNDCTVLMLDAARFVQVVTNNQDGAHTACILYARRFVAGLNQSVAWQHDIIDDNDFLMEGQRSSDMSQRSSEGGSPMKQVLSDGSHVGLS
eukprot:gnl/TRDRNA2_/TRDRNA2_153859_c0_seq1.p1 gnl/TRDRNA2_/TRDRNA2_153859_c0~~gnl/TRDRNA2_/TRDRNA2_153859_c0_seq1.p1  ORF type:complete len:411 (-),score=63.40 gnl/TRDRNA2_/TRDRNA2_153859_c0_seq1:159-1391(-)